MGAMVEPVSGEEIIPKLDKLKPLPSIALAVSGGPDSMALLYLVNMWVEASGQSCPEIRVLTVDHGLRKQSAREAEFVKLQCRAYGHLHDTLVWQGEKPIAGLQEAARDARYDLITDYCKRHFIPAIVTAHHLDDQAETILMRLARGSGLDGLAGMAPKTQRSGIEIFRPLLSYSKERLIATLYKAGWNWMEDPSNQDTQFERVRWRNSLPDLEKLGLAPSTLVKSAQRLGRARHAIERQADRIAGDLVAVYPIGFAAIDWQQYYDLPDEFALRILGRVILGIGGGLRPPQLSKLENLHANLMDGAYETTKCMTLGRCQIENDGKNLRIFREVRSADNVELLIEPGEKAIWDDRFLVEVFEKAPKPVIVRHLTESQFLGLDNSGHNWSTQPVRSRASLVSIWSEEHLQAVPQINYYSSSSNYNENTVPYRVTFNNYLQIYGTRYEN